MWPKNSLCCSGVISDFGRVHSAVAWLTASHSSPGAPSSASFSGCFSFFSEIVAAWDWIIANNATLGIHCGSFFFSRPSIGSWVSHGLGTVNANLPTGAIEVRVDDLVLQSAADELPLPQVKIRVVNVVNLMKLQPAEERKGLLEDVLGHRVEVFSA